MKNISLSLLATSLLFIGCGSSSSSPSTQTESVTEVTEITVERGPVIGAYVIDADGNIAKSVGEGKYQFNFKDPAYPIKAYGGYIDANRDGVADTSDAKLDIPLELHNEGENKITIVTTLAKDEALKNEILNEYGLSEEDLYTKLPSDSFEVAAISDEVFKYCKENNVSVDEVNLTVFQSLNTDILQDIENMQLEVGEIEEIVSQRETELLQDLNITFSDDELDSIVLSSETTPKDPTNMLSSMPLYTLSDEQKEGLVFMYEEEKVARDIYLKLYELYPNKEVFKNIATNSEQSHMEAVEAILEKYNLTIPISSDIDNTSLMGIFTNSTLQDLYNQLLAQGSVSEEEALKVGVLVEETDIKDLEELIVGAPDDIKVIYQSLLDASYKHLEAFTNNLNGTNRQQAGEGNGERRRKGKL